MSLEENNNLRLYKSLKALKRLRTKNLTANEYYNMLGIKVSNYIKENLIFLHRYFHEVNKNKNFFGKDLKKNIFYHGKERMKSLVKFYFISRPKKNYTNLTLIELIILEQIMDIVIIQMVLVK